MWGRGGGRRFGREIELQVWKGMKGFHGNLCLPVAKVALQIPQASFPWTLKPTSPAAEAWLSKDGGAGGYGTFGKGGGEGGGKLSCWNQGALQMPPNP